MTPAQAITTRRDGGALSTDGWQMWFQRLHAGTLPVYQRAAMQVTASVFPLDAAERQEVSRLLGVGTSPDVFGIGCPGLLGAPVPAGRPDGEPSLSGLLSRKIKGGQLSSADLGAFIAAVADGRASDAQVAAFTMAVYLRGMTTAETAALTRAMATTGEILSVLPPGAKGFVVDKHSTGGVGDKVSLPLAAVLAACGMKVPMISGRGLGHTGGTLDKLQAIPGLRVDLSSEEIKTIVGVLGAVITGQTAQLAPADRRLYAIRDVTGTVASIPLITASILSKKLAEGLHGLLMDIKVGSGAFMRTLPEAQALARSLVKTGEGLGAEVGAGVPLQIKALITAMDRPVGRKIGNALEVAEAIACLRGWGPADLRTLVVEQAARLMAMVGVETDPVRGRLRAASVLDDGSALKKFRGMVRAQGGDVRVVDDPERLPRAPHQALVPAPADGVLSRMDALALGQVVVLLGGGRQAATDPIDPSVGLELLKQVGEPTLRGEPLVRIHASSREKLEQAIEKVQTAIQVGHKFEGLPLIVGEM